MGCYTPLSIFIHQCVDLVHMYSIAFVIGVNYAWEPLEVPFRGLERGLWIVLQLDRTGTRDGQE
jgi:hypothetical protein